MHYCRRIDTFSNWVTPTVELFRVRVRILYTHTHTCVEINFTENGLYFANTAWLISSYFSLALAHTHTHTHARNYTFASQCITKKRTYEDDADACARSTQRRNIFGDFE